MRLCSPPRAKFDIGMIEQGFEAFRADLGGEEPLVIAEITMRNLLADGSLDLNDFLARVDVLDGGILEAFGRLFRRDVRRRIAEGDAPWEETVPATVPRVIKQRSLFGYTPNPG